MDNIKASESSAAAHSCSCGNCSEIVIDKHAHEHGHEHSHEHGHNDSLLSTKNIRIASGAVVFLVAEFAPLPFPIKLALYIIAYLVIGYDILLSAVKNIAAGHLFDENFLMSIATVGAFAVGEYPEGVAVMLFFQIGEFFQDLAVSKSKRSIVDLMDLRPDYANLLDGNETRKVSPETVNIGDIIVVKPGEKIPLDGIITEGSTELDVSAMSGESLPKAVKPGDEVLSGSLNINGMIQIEVKKKFGESAVSRILELVQNASKNKSKSENFITKFARYYTPAVVFSALALAVIPPLFTGGSFSEWIYRALLFLVISCPCALVVSIPLSFLGGIGGASKNGILVKGGNYLEALNSVDTVVFDKTGTLTKGNFTVTKIHNLSGESDEAFLEKIALAESGSNHPIAVSVLKKYGKVPEKSRIESYEEIRGKGVKAVVDGIVLLVGNAKLLENQDQEFEVASEPGTVLYTSIDGKYAGYILIADEIKEDSSKAIQGLKNIGIKNIVMLTGDNKAIAQSVGKTLGIERIHSELLPDQKVEIVEKLKVEGQKGKKILFVGDGINDAPVLALSDIGVAMGGIGSDAAIEASDMVLMSDEPHKLVNAFKVAEKTRKIVLQNIVFALGIKAIVMLIGALGFATMWEAVFADVGVALIAVLNAMRAMRT